jgi:hypothetical protein
VKKQLLYEETLKSEHRSPWQNWEHNACCVESERPTQEFEIDDLVLVPWVVRCFQIFILP